MRKILSLTFFLFAFSQSIAQVDTLTPEKKVRYRIDQIKGKKVNALPDYAITNSLSSIANMAAKRTPIVTITELKTGLADTASVVFIKNGDRSGMFRYNPSSSLVDDSTMAINVGGKIFEREHEGTINIKWYGARGDGSSDDSKAIINARNFIFRSIKNDPLGSDRITGYTLYFPAGTYKVTSSEALIPTTQLTKARGFTMLGDGPGLTFINFSPATGSKYLFYNRAYSNLVFRGINFYSNAATNRFMYANSTVSVSTTQRYNFDQCQWSGLWDRGFLLEGDNNNSEWAFTDCGVSGQMGTFMEIPATNSSDQFLNFWFTRMKFWPTTTTGSNFIDFSKGGSISISDSDFSGLQSGLLFALRGNTHAYGVQRFSCRDSRFELKSSNCSVLYSQWADGDVIFDGCDFSSQAGAYSPTAITFNINLAGVVKGPAYRFTNCNLIGLINVEGNSSNKFSHKESIIFDQCQFPQQRFIERAFSFTNPTVNIYGRAPVKIRDSQPGGAALSGYGAWAASTAVTVGTRKTNGGRLYNCVVAGTTGTVNPLTTVYTGIVDGTATWDFDGIDTRMMPGTMSLNSLKSMGFNPTKQYLYLTAPDVSIPSSSRSITAILPPDAIITGIRFYSPSGAVTQTASEVFKLSTSESVPTDIYTYTATNYNAGFTDNSVLFYPVGTDMGKRVVNFKAQTATANNAGAILILEYIN